MYGSCAASSGGLGLGAHSAAAATFAAALQFFVTSQCLISEPWPEQANLQTGASFDFIVVGGGTAGATLASRLSEIDTFSVLLIEAGGNPPEDSIIPGFRDAIKFSKNDWNYTTEDDHVTSQELQNGSQRHPRGRLLGGCGSMGDLVYSRGMPADYEEWASVAGDEWNWSSVLKYFKKTEHMTDEAIADDPELMALHSVGGEIEVSGTMELSHTAKVFIDSFNELGYSVVKDMTNPHSVGVGRFSHTIRNGRRDSVVTALLNRASKRPNLSVMKDTMVTQIVMENKKATGVKAVHDGKEFLFHASKEVIVSAGSYNTPQLLMLSGIGPKHQLEKHGINVVSDLSGVGENLHDHSMVLLHIATDPGTCPSLTTSTYMEMMRYLYDHSGYLSKTDSIGVHITRPEEKLPKFGAYPVCLPKGFDYFDACMNVIGYKEPICRQLAKVNEESDLVTIALVLLKPKSRGRVILKSPNPYEKPLIYAGSFNNTEDLVGLPQVMDHLQTLIKTKHFKEKNGRVIVLGTSWCKNADDKVCMAKQLAMSTWHAAGTAALGSVLDGELRVRGTEALRVADASVMPTPLRGHTNAAVIMIAEKAASFIKKLYGFES